MVLPSNKLNLNAIHRVRETISLTAISASSKVSDLVRSNVSRQERRNTAQQDVIELDDFQFQNQKDARSHP